jgi:hypothetical protein
VLDRIAMRTQPPSTPPTIAASCGFERSAPIAPTGIDAPMAKGAAEEVDNGTVTVVSITGRGGKEGRLLAVVLDTLSKTLVSKRIPVEVKDSGPKTGGNVDGVGEAIETAVMGASAGENGAFVRRGDIAFDKVDGGNGMAADGVENAAEVTDKAPPGKALGEAADLDSGAEDRS